MKSQTTYLGAALGLLLAGGASTAAAADAPKAAKPKARVYTNDDLDRIHPYAAQTGGGSTPASEDVEPGAGPDEPRSEARGEAYWRAEAAQVRERVRELEQRAAELRRRIAERTERARQQREPEVFGRRGRRASSPSAGTASLERSLAALERRIRSNQDDLEERARREGALPGWLR